MGSSEFRSLSNLIQVRFVVAVMMTRLFVFGRCR